MLKIKHERSKSEKQSKGPFIAMQLNLLDVELSWVELCRYKRAFSSWRSPGVKY